MNRRQALRKAMVLTAGGILVPACGIIARPPAFNPGFIRNRGAAAAGAACDTARDTFNGANSSGNAFNSISRFGSSFVKSGTHTICKATCHIFKEGTPAGTMRFGIFSDSGGNPGALHGSYSDAYNCTLANGTAADFTFSNMSATLTDGVTYHAVLECSVAGDGTNRIVWMYEENGGHAIDYFDGSWHDFLTAQSSKYILFSV